MFNLTKRQKQIYDFIENYITKNDISPTHEEIKKYLKVGSPATVHEHIDALIKKGVLIKNKNLSRGLEINKKDELVKIPLLGTIVAGQPIEAIEEKETIAIPKSKLPSNGNIFALKVLGESMIDENINDGDFVIINQQTTALNGQRVVALINNEEATLKKFFIDKNKIRLEPANQ